MLDIAPATSDLCAMKVFINGFGRIGRTMLRQILAAGDIEVVGINDIAPLDTCAYLFKYDSVFGPFAGDVTTSDGLLNVAGTALPFHHTPDVSMLDLNGVDVVLECTGKANTRDVADRGLRAGARFVLISGPSDAADITAVKGVNADALGTARIVSNASCTTNAIAPLVKALDSTLGLTHGHITTIHCYTGSQPTLDAPGPSLERSRAAAVSMVPTSTSAAAQLDRVLPGISAKLSISAVRVPVISVSAIDAVFQTEAALPQDVTGWITDHVTSNVIATTPDRCVSSDLRGHPASLIVQLSETQRIGDHQLRLLGWYDNEWGFSARMIDMARLLIKRTG